MTSENNIYANDNRILRLYLCLIIILLIPLSVLASSSSPLSGDTILSTRDFLKKTQREMIVRIKDVNKIDTNYIEPEHYNFTAMVQNTNAFEFYRLRSQNGQSLVLAPRPSVRLGPYFGWRWAFAGYTFDVGHMVGKKRLEIDLSIYSSKIGVDLFYKNSGENFLIRDVNLNNDIDTKPLNNKRFNGLNVEMMGFNVYYIFNHHKFSYPAAFSQSTRQKKSAGSVIAGIGYSRHHIGLDYQRLQTMINENLLDYSNSIDSVFLFNTISYVVFSASAGYAYNYVVTRNLLLAASLVGGFGYKRSSGDVSQSNKNFRDFAFNNFVFDAVGRFGIVWNNDRFFAGTSFIIHSYNSRKAQLSMNNFFGNLNIYTGIKFGKRKQYKNKN